MTGISEFCNIFQWVSLTLSSNWHISRSVRNCLGFQHFPPYLNRKCQLYWFEWYFCLHTRPTLWGLIDTLSGNSDRQHSVPANQSDWDFRILQHNSMSFSHAELELTHFQVIYAKNGENRQKHVFDFSYWCAVRNCLGFQHFQPYLNQYSYHRSNFPPRMIWDCIWTGKCRQILIWVQFRFTHTTYIVGT